MNNLVLEKDIPIKEVLKCFVESGEGVAFLVENAKLFGSISDGDIRKALLNGLGIDSPAAVAANQSCVFVRQDASPLEVHKAFGKEGVTLVPVVDQSNRLVRILRPNDRLVIPVCEPNIGHLEREWVNRALDAGWISSTGNFVGDFERKFSDFVGTDFSVAVANGTLGLVLALKVLEIGPGHEVIIPNLTFGATANAVIQVGARPVFVDVETDSANISAGAISAEISSRTRAIMPVHLYGKPANMVEILEIAKRHNLKVIEDAAEAIGSSIGDKHVGTFGDIGVFSFFANKTITTGEGGMLVFNNPEYLDKARSMRSHGFSIHQRYWHETWGSNFRLTNLQAALGCAQMERIHELVEAKRRIYSTYHSILLPELENQLSLMGDVPGEINSHWLILVKFKIVLDIEELLRDLSINGIETRRAFVPLNRQPAFQEFDKQKNSYENSYAFFNSTICLPSSTNLTFEDIELVCFRLKNYLNDIRSKKNST